MSQKSVYLAGPFDGASLEKVLFWRNRAAKLLEDHSIKVERPDLHIGIDDLILRKSSIPEHDMKMIAVCHGLLGYVDYSLPSVGTNMEIMYARTVMQIPMVLWTPHLEPGAMPSCWHRWACDGFYDQSLEKCVATLVERMK